LLADDANWHLRASNCPREEPLKPPDPVTDVRGQLLIILKYDQITYSITAWAGRMHSLNFVACYCLFPVNTTSPRSIIIIIVWDQAKISILAPSHGLIENEELASSYWLSKREGKACSMMFTILGTFRYW
jgi:hypothetical protein